MDWKEIREELEELRLGLGINLAPAGRGRC